MHYFQLVRLNHYLDHNVLTKTMNTFEYMPPLMYQGNVVVSGVDMGLVAVGAGGAIIVLVVIVVIAKKQGRF